MTCKLGKNLCRSTKWFLGLALLLFFGTHAFANNEPILVEVFSSCFCEPCEQLNQPLLEWQRSHQDALVVSFHLWQDALEVPGGEERSDFYALSSLPGFVVQGNQKWVGSISHFPATLESALGVEKNRFRPDYGMQASVEFSSTQARFDVSLSKQYSRGQIVGLAVQKSVFVEGTRYSNVVREIQVIPWKNQPAQVVFSARKEWTGNNVLFAVLFQDTRSGKVYHLQVFEPDW
ncbi:MAG TPA: hypothetical protein P5560_08245 [Thermotogota bacterium]|nr:hypothetical protein [Thermotogota bacterium]